MTANNASLSARAFYGRRQGRPLRAAQRAVTHQLLPSLLLSCDEPRVSQLADLFPACVKKFYLEIGFGGGEHLFHRLKEEPDAAFIGVEPFVNGMSKLLSRISDFPELQSRLRLYDKDASELLGWLPSQQFSGIYLLYPDPWPKTRHWKRRFVNHKHLDEFGRLLNEGGFFRFATDIESYVDWTLGHIQQRDDFVWEVADPSACFESFPGWISTRYEQKALREGRRPHYFHFVRPCYLGDDVVY